MLDLESVPQTYDDAVTLLASWHRSQDDPSFAAYSCPDPSGIVRLVEVSDRFPSQEEVRPVNFGPSVDFPFRSSVLQITSQDWRRIESGDLHLPEDWRLEDRQRVDI